MTRKWDREMILSGILVALILIRHTVIGTYADDYKPRWSNGINQHQQHLQHQHHHQQQQHHSRTAQQAISFPHHQHRHHHADYMNKNNREMHIKSQHSQFYLDSADATDADYQPARPATATTTRPTVTTSSWKWSSATTAATAAAANLGSPQLTHISINYQAGNETNEEGGSMVPLKNRLDAGKRLQQWTPSNKRTYIWPYQVKPTNNDETPTRTFKADHHNLRSSGSHYRDSHSHQEQQEQAARQPATNSRKNSRIDAVDPTEISHEDQGFKNKAVYDEDYDDNDYYEELDGNGNKIEERREDADTEDVIVEHRIDDTNSQKEAIKSDEEEAAKNARDDKNSRLDVEDDYSSEFLRDDPFSSNDDQNQTVSLTEIKWKNLGTGVAVARSRQQYLNSPQNKVDAHIQRLKEEGKCRWPRPKVIPLIDASNRFIPHCTILHRCADDTGCCDDDKKTCVAKKSTSVDLYFYIIPIHNHSKPSIELRKFDNHTECHCVDKSRHRRTIRHNNYANFLNTATANQSCRCPNHFHAVMMDRSQCRCDCFTWNQDCYDLKEGRDRLPIEDQRCISENKCQKPTCEHGHYNKHSGRCPRGRTSSSSSSLHRKNYR